MDKRAIMMDNYLNPSNKETVIDDNYLKSNSKIESCIDNINIYMLMDGDIIKDLKFDGEACGISTAASSIITKLLIGKTKGEALDIIDNYEKMVNNLEYDKEILGDAVCFDEIYKQENRKKCTLLPIKGIKKMMN